MYAGFWLRFFAAFLDGLILLPIALALMYLGVTIYGGFEQYNAGQNSFLITAILWLVSWLYHSILHSSSWQATLGKKIIGIYIATSAHQRVTFLLATLRFWLEAIPALLLSAVFIYVEKNIASLSESDLVFLVIFGIAVSFYGLAQYIVCGVTLKKQTLYDLACRTIVIRGTPSQEHPLWAREALSDKVADMGVHQGSNDRWVISGFDSDGHVLRHLVQGHNLKSNPAGLIIGRGRDCDIVISDSSVSRKHACLYYDNGRIFIRDLNSSNGTIVNGSLLHGNQQSNLLDNYTISLGDVHLTISRTRP